MLQAPNSTKIATARASAHPVLTALDHLCAARQREAIAWRAYTIARGAARRAETKVERLEDEAGMRRRDGRRS